MIAVQGTTTDNLHIAILNEPSSRSLNSVGFGHFGLLTAQRIIYIGANNFLIKWNVTDSTTPSNWSLLEGNTVSKILDMNLSVALNEKNWKKVTAF